MSFKTLIPTLIGKTISKILLLRNKSRGETFPGLIVLKLNKNFIHDTNRSISHRIIISGTNGKTTTTAMVTKVLRDKGISFITNPSGSNLTRGIAAASLNISNKITHLLWEVDEAALTEVCQQVQPTHLVFTNLFRDQLDRYGETDTILHNWIILLKKLPKLQLILNADDPSLVYLGQQANQHNVIYFSVRGNPNNKLDDSSDSIFCPHCRKPLVYKTITFSHLGQFSCSCGFQSPKLNFIINSFNYRDKYLQININNLSNMTLPLIGTYNVYNSLAAYVLLNTLNFNNLDILTYLKDFQPAFGRQEIMRIKNKNILTILVKNPTGFNQAIETLIQLNKKLTLMIAINDKTADGKDVSWLWDVDFEKLTPIIDKLIISGDRADDMAVRIKYADFPNPKIQVINDKIKALETFLHCDDKNLYLLPTYTALWEIRKLIKNYE